MINDLSGNRLEKMCSKEMIEKNLGKPDRIFLYDVSLPFSKDRQLLNFPQNVEEIWEYDINAEAIGYFDYYYFRIGFDKEGNYCCSEPATK